MHCLSYGKGVCPSVRPFVALCDPIKTTQAKVTKSSLSAPRKTTCVKLYCRLEAKYSCASEVGVNTGRVWNLRLRKPPNSQSTDRVGHCGHTFYAPATDRRKRRHYVFYARQLYRQVLLRARISYGNSVCPSVWGVTTRYRIKPRWDRDSGYSPYGSLVSLVSDEVIWCRWVRRFFSNEGIKEGYPPKKS